MPLVPMAWVNFDQMHLILVEAQKGWVRLIQCWIRPFFQRALGPNGLNKKQFSVCEVLFLIEFGENRRNMMNGDI